MVAGVAGHFTILIQVPAAIVALTPSSARRLAATAVAAAAQEQSSTFAVQADLIRQIPLTANDLVYSPTTKMLYASVPSSVSAGGNSITTIDPTSTAVVASTFVGSEPDRLALSDDGHSLYTSLAGAYSVRRFDVLTQTPGAQFVVGRIPRSGFIAWLIWLLHPETPIW